MQPISWMINKIGRPGSSITRMITDRIKRIISWHNYKSLSYSNERSKSFGKTKGNSKFWFWGAWNIELIQVQAFDYGMCKWSLLSNHVGAIYWQGRRVSCRQIVQAEASSVWIFRPIKTTGRDFHLQTNESSRKELILVWWTDRTQDEILE